MRFNTPCSRIRSSLVETPSSCSSVLPVFFCADRVEKGWAKLEAINATEVRAKKVRLGVSMDLSFQRPISAPISAPSVLKTCAAPWAKAHEQYCSFRMLSVNRREEIRLAVG